MAGGCCFNNITTMYALTVTTIAKACSEFMTEVFQFETHEEANIGMNKTIQLAEQDGYHITNSNYWNCEMQFFVWQN